MKLSIIVPVYNEEKTIEKVLEKLEKFSVPKVSKEIIIVNDASTDKTLEKIKNQRLKIKELKIIKHEKNLGKGAAIQSGIKYATGDYIVIQDADLEYDPRFIKYLLQPILEKKAQIVYGTRLNRIPHFTNEEKTAQFFLHYLGNRILSFLTSILYGQWITDMETGYKIIPRKIFEKLELKAMRFDFEPEITAKLLKKGHKIIEIPITTIPRTYNEGKKLHTFRDGIIAFWTLVKYRFVE